jgi:hypothetical protein
VNFVRELSIVRGWPDTVATLGEWRRNPKTVLVWLLVSLAIAVVLLTLVLVIANASPASPERPTSLPDHLSADPFPHAVVLLRNNLVVLALHAVACFAGYVIYRAASDEGEGWLGETTRGLATVAFLFVPCATLLSIGTQAWVLGSYASTASSHLALTPAQLLTTTLPHSIVELTAVFLPLAAWLVIRATGRPQQLLAATLVSTTIAIPVLTWAAWNEASGWAPRVLAMRAKHPRIEHEYVGTMRADPRSLDSATMLVTIGPAVSEREFSTVPAARAVAAKASGKGAVVVVRTPDGIFVHELNGVIDPSECDTNSGPPGRRGLVHITGAARFEPTRTSTNSGVQVVELVEGRQHRTLPELMSFVAPNRDDC